MRMAVGVTGRVTVRPFPPTHRIEHGRGFITGAPAVLGVRCRVTVHYFGFLAPF